MGLSLQPSGLFIVRERVRPSPLIATLGSSNSSPPACPFRVSIPSALLVIDCSSVDDCGEMLLHSRKFSVCYEADHIRSRIMLHHHLRSNLKHLVKLIGQNVHMWTSHVARYKRHGPPDGRLAGALIRVLPSSSEG
jgi:hypothetical protein